MIASYVDQEGEERAFDVACLGDFNALVDEARCSVLLEHENGSSVAFSGGESVAFLVWTDPLGYVYSWQGEREHALACVQTYLETGWPTSEAVRFTHDGSSPD
ncbi:hypothetical protein EFL95_04450 [Nocardioides marmorisolisilvae]|uniref:Uncharacterized protein n=1 Tax=Nocardioides marmorisolisilvae TaxID=1542737 RepID=A0A3N0DRW0_9ACTN|nr:hypothetical protein EFL95_04450 [Nocardioides marmorisolisilvae]